MRLVVYQGEDGLYHRALVRDQDPDLMAAYGVPVDPPDVINAIDWTQVARELHNLLVQRGVVDWDSAIRQTDSLSSAIMTVLKPRLVNLFKQTR